MANCKNKKLIGPYLDGQLGECRWLDEHIAECPECLVEYEMIQRIAHIAEKVDFAPPESNYWKNFSTRVSARIAARQRPRFYTRVLENILGSKLLTRIAAPVAVVLIGVLIFGIANYSDSFKTEPQVDVITSTDAVVNNAENVNMPVLIDEVSELATQTVEPANIDADHINESVAVEPSKVLGPDFQQINSNSDKIEQAENKFDELAIRDFTADDIRLLMTHRSNKKKLGLSDLAWTELTSVRSINNFNLRSLNTDQVIRYQIIAGSNSSLVPLSSHCEAASRYFAPQWSLSRDANNRSVSSNWGYAGGDNSFDFKRFRHLNLELKLSTEK